MSEADLRVSRSALKLIEISGSQVPSGKSLLMEEHKNIGEYIVENIVIG